MRHGSESVYKPFLRRFRARDGTFILLRCSESILGVSLGVLGAFCDRW